MFANPIYWDMLKVSCAIAKEEAKQKRTAEKVVCEQTEKQLEELIADLGDLFEE